MRHIGEFTILLEKDDQVVFQLGTQTHRGKEFTPDGRQFRSLYSHSKPSSGNWVLNVKGGKELEALNKKGKVVTEKLTDLQLNIFDNTILVARRDMFKQYEKDRKVYNKRFK